MHEGIAFVLDNVFPGDSVKVIILVTQPSAKRIPSGMNNKLTCFIFGKLALDVKRKQSLLTKRQYNKSQSRSFAQNFSNLAARPLFLLPKFSV